MYFNNLYKYIVLLFSLLIQYFVSSQEYSYTNFSTEDGLPSSIVYHAFQDSKGYIWFATDNGVSRFNGISFKNFDLNDGLPKNTVLEIYEDYKGRIWFVTVIAELAYFENGKIYSYKHNKKISTIFYKKKLTLKSSFYIDSLDNIYIGKQYSGIYKISKNGEISFILTSKKSTINNFNPINDFLIKLDSNKYYYSNSKNLYSFDGSNITNHIQFDTEIKWLSKDKKNNLWLCNDDGGAIFYKNGNLSNPINKHLKNYIVSSVLQDNNDDYWFTTMNNGIFYLSLKNIFSYTVKNGLLNNNIKSIEIDNNNIWIAYNSNKISKLNKNKFTHIEVSNNDNVKIKKLLYDKNKKQLLIGSSDYLFVINNKKTERRPSKNKFNSTEIDGNININDIAINNKGNYYVLACKNGIELYKNNKLNKYLGDLSIFSLNTNSILFDNDSSIWLGTINGLWKYENKLFIDYGRINKKFKITVLDIIKYKNKLIIATKGGGILIYNNNKITQLTKNNGLSSNTITTLLITDNNKLWAGSINGLNSIVLNDNDNYIINNQNFYKLISNEIRDIKKNKNRLIIATNKGLYFFDYKKQFKKPIKVPLYLNNIKINGIDTVIKSNYVLHSNQNNIEITFEAVFFKKVLNLQYRYKILGLDTNWITTKNNIIRLSKLQYGDYKVIIKVFDFNNDILTNKHIIKIKIKKPLWIQEFMIGIYIISILVLFYILYLVRMKKVQQKMIIEQDINWHKKQALFSQMNPHFLFNALNSINNYILHNEKRAASKHLSKLSVLIRRILENSQNEYILLENEIATNKLYLEIEKLRLKNKFEFEFIIDKDIDTHSMKIPGMILQPFLENSVWHGIQLLDKKGIITINLKKKKHTIIITVKDNGIGREKTKEIKNKTKSTHKSLGINIVRKRINLMKKHLNKDISIEYIDIYEKENPMGTSVIITIPFV